MKKMKERPVCGYDKEIMYNGQDKKEVLDLELIKIGGNVKNGDGYYAIELRLNNKKLVRLHILEAIELKSIIDCLVYDSLTSN